MAKFFNLFQIIKYKIKLGNKNFNDLKELLDNIMNVFNFEKKKIKLNIGNNKKVSISASNENEKYLSEIDFKTRDFVQNRTQENHILTPFYPNQKIEQKITGTLDGSIYSARTINNRSDNLGNSMTVLTNEKTGTQYRRYTNPNGQTFYQKKVGNIYMDLFPKV